MAFSAATGYNGMALDAGAGIDQTRTPFLRALRWTDCVGILARLAPVHAGQFTYPRHEVRQRSLCGST
jgi:hypothetical protein